MLCFQNSPTVAYPKIQLSGFVCARNKATIRIFALPKCQKKKKPSENNRHFCSTSTCTSSFVLLDAQTRFGRIFARQKSFKALFSHSFFFAVLQVLRTLKSEKEEGFWRSKVLHHTVTDWPVGSFAKLMYVLSCVGGSRFRNIRCIQQ